MKQHLFRKKEDVKYNTVLAGRPCEDEETRKKRKVEDSELNHRDVSGRRIATLIGGKANPVWRLRAYY